MKNFWRLLASVIFCELAGVIGAVFTLPAIPGWYAGLYKPLLIPPSWVFAPVWSALYLLLGVALFLVWKNEWKIVRPLVLGSTKAWNRWSWELWAGKWQKANVLAVFGAQWLLNIAWSAAFFGLKNSGVAFFILLALWVSIVYVMVNFYRVSKAAAWLLAPYLLWVTFAGYLNLAFWVLN